FARPHAATDNATPDNMDLAANPPGTIDMASRPDGMITAPPAFCDVHPGDFPALPVPPSTESGVTALAPNATNDGESHSVRTECPAFPHVSSPWTAANPFDVLNFSPHITMMVKWLQLFVGPDQVGELRALEVT